MRPASLADDVKAIRSTFCSLCSGNCSTMAPKQRADMLAYLIEMPALEATEACKVHEYKTELYVEN